MRSNPVLSVKVHKWHKGVFLYFAKFTKLIFKKELTQSLHANGWKKMELTLSFYQSNDIRNFSKKPFLSLTHISKKTCSNTSNHKKNPYSGIAS